MAYFYAPTGANQQLISRTLLSALKEISDEYYVLCEFHLPQWKPPHGGRARSGCQPDFLIIRPEDGSPEANWSKFLVVEHKRQLGTLQTATENGAWTVQQRNGTPLTLYSRGSNPFQQTTKIGDTTTQWLRDHWESFTGEVLSEESRERIKAFRALYAEYPDMKVAPDLGEQPFHPRFTKTEDLLACVQRPPRDTGPSFSVANTEKLIAHLGLTPAIRLNGVQLRDEPPTPRRTTPRRTVPQSVDPPQASNVARTHQAARTDPPLQAVHVDPPQQAARVVRPPQVVHVDPAPSASQPYSLEVTVTGPTNYLRIYHPESTALISLTSNELRGLMSRDEARSVGAAGIALAVESGSVAVRFPQACEGLMALDGMDLGETPAPLAPGSHLLKIGESELRIEVARHQLV